MASKYELSPGFARKQLITKEYIYRCQPLHCISQAQPHWRRCERHFRLACGEEISCAHGRAGVRSVLLLQHGRGEARRGARQGDLSQQAAGRLRKVPLIRLAVVAELHELPEVRREVEALGPAGGHRGRRGLAGRSATGALRARRGQRQAVSVLRERGGRLLVLRRFGEGEPVRPRRAGAAGAQLPHADRARGHERGRDGGPLSHGAGGLLRRPEWRPGRLRVLDCVQKCVGTGLALAGRRCQSKWRCCLDRWARRAALRRAALAQDGVVVPQGLRPLRTARAMRRRNLCSGSREKRLRERRRRDPSRRALRQHGRLQHRPGHSRVRIR